MLPPWEALPRTQQRMRYIKSQGRENKYGGNGTIYHNDGCIVFHCINQVVQTGILEFKFGMFIHDAHGISFYNLTSNAISSFSFRNTGKPGSLNQHFLMAAIS